MTNLITEARELCERAEILVNELHTERIDYNTEYLPLIDAIQTVPALCDALEKAEEKNKQLMHELCKLACESVGREKTLARLEAEVMAALREKQERDKGCEHCKQGEDLAYGHDSMQRTGRIYLDGNLLTADLYSESMAVAVCYCPMCGAKMEGKPCE